MTARKTTARTLPLHLILLAVGAVMVVPLVYAVLSGFKSTDELSSNPFGLPESLADRQLHRHPRLGGDFWRLLGSSTLIAVGTTVLVVAASALAAFSFARFAFRGREALFTLFTMGLMFPFAVAVLPLFLLLRSLGLLDNPLGVILPQAAFGLPMTIIILRAFFRQIPGELEEAATLDGCSPFGFFWRVLLPMARPALGTVSVLAVVTSWNNFMLPLLVFTDNTWWTLPDRRPAVPGPVLRGLRPCLRLPRAGDGSRPRLLLGRRASARRRPHRRRHQGLTARHERTALPTHPHVRSRPMRTHPSETRRRPRRALVAAGLGAGPPRPSGTPAAHPRRPRPAPRPLLRQRHRQPRTRRRPVQEPCSAASSTRSRPATA